MWKYLIQLYGAIFWSTKLDISECSSWESGRKGAIESFCHRQGVYRGMLQQPGARGVEESREVCTCQRSRVMFLSCLRSDLVLRVPSLDERGVTGHHCSIWEHLSIIQTNLRMIISLLTWHTFIKKKFVCLCCNFGKIVLSRRGVIGPSLVRRVLTTGVLLGDLAIARSGGLARAGLGWPS